MLKKIFYTLILLTLIGVTVLSGYLYYHVVIEPGDEIQAANIHRILAKESHVFYSDGETKFGVFFDQAHRQYVKYNEIPRTFINALVASEDDKFFQHYGFDLFGIGRAMIKNIQAGRVVQGGSTLTQQTAKNLFKRNGRSYQAKLKELLFALRLEYHYSKEKIFEFYANQFYVSGNGHGLGVAARYYFDKNTQDLTLLESAFIAGSVKRPNYYNPLIKKTEVSADLARTRARVRVRYVLEKMLDLGMIDRFTYSQNLNQEIPFNKGQVGFDLDYGMELVRDAVSTTEVLEALEENDISSIATSGARIITTIDKDLQDRALVILRSELSRLDVRLRGYEREEVQSELADLAYAGDSSIGEGSFVFGTIDNFRGEGRELKIVVNFDNNLGQGVIEREGLAKLVKARTKFLLNRWSEPGKGDTKKLLEQMQKGDRVWVKIQEIRENGAVILTLEKFPQVQGGAIVLKDGFIKAMAGGVENRFFNRAVHARRTMGSSFKPLVYTAALQLGWNSVDELKNTRDVFVYHDQPYFPRPDHISTDQWVSMSWAGVRSENVASVWLVSHLCDHLSSLQFREVAEQVGLAPKIVDGEEEPYRSYKARIRDRFGIQVNRKNLRATAYKLAVKNIETDFIFDGLSEEYHQIEKLHFGLNFDTFYEDIELTLEDEEEDLKDYEIKELELRKDILKNSFLVLEELNTHLIRYKAYVEGDDNSTEVDEFETFGDAALYYNQVNGEYYFLAADAVTPGLVLIDEFDLIGYLQLGSRIEKDSFWENVKLNGELSVAAFNKVSVQTEYEYKKLLSQLPYSFEVLSQVDDFRTTVGLYYLIEFAKQLGINSGLEPVLSFPLGSNVITLLEATRMYEGLVTGKVSIVGNGGEGGESSDALAILDRIESSDGRILYQATPEQKSVVDRKSRVAVGSILENIVKFGTGRAADKKIRLREKDVDSESEISDLAVPVLGKTGTANRYTNAAFLGYLPGVNETGSALEVGDGFAVGVYSGYDKNQPMRRKSTRISGAQGALPAWIDIVNTLLQEQKYTGKLDVVDLTFNGLNINWDPLGQVNIGVDPAKGGKVVEPVMLLSEGVRYQPSIITFGKKTETGRFIKERNFQPYWRVDKHPAQ